MNDILRNLNLDLLSVGIAVAAAAIFGFIVFFNNQKSVTNRAFLIFTMITSAWGITNYLQYQAGTPSIAFLLLRATVFFAVLQAFSLFRLFFVFPEEQVLFPRLYRFLLLPLVALTAFLTLTPLVFEKIAEVSASGQIVRVTNGPGIFLFGAVSMGLVISGVAMLFLRMRRTTGVAMNQFQLVGAGAAIMFTLIIGFNFIFPAFLDNPRFIPLGAVFTLPFIGFTAYAILKYRLLNIRVIATEILTLVVVIIMFFEVLIARTLGELMFRAAIFGFLLLFGVLLTRSVRKEVRQREELERLSKQLTSANEELKKLDVAKSEFVSIASHQLLTPLTAIKGYTSLVIEGSIGTISLGIKDALEKVMFATGQLVKLVSELLNLSRIETGKIEFHFVPDNLGTVIQEVVEEATHKANGKSVTLRVENSLGNLSFPFDRDKMREVVWNLVDNAIKYSPAKATVTIEAKTMNDSFVRIMVRDQGIGIPKGDMGRLFEKFGRAENARSVDPGGMGIGLYFVKRIVESHHGRVRAESEGIGKGSAFIVELPLGDNH